MITPHIAVSSLPVPRRFAGSIQNLGCPLVPGLFRRPPLRISGSRWRSPTIHRRKPWAIARSPA